MEEIWKDVVGYEGLYQVSNIGNVRSLNWRNTGSCRNLYLKHHINGYRQVELRFNGKRKMFVVHRLVATAFIPNPQNLPQINHKDENKENNRVDNLEWCDCSYNVKYSIKKRKNATRRNYFGRNSKYKSVGIIQTGIDGTVVRVWENPRTIFLETGMSDWSISECCRGNRKTAYGYKWQYAN